MTFMLKYWRTIAIILAFAGLVGSLWLYGHRKYQAGYNTAWDKCLADQQKADMEGVKNREEINRKNVRLSDPDIDKRIIDKWLRSGS